MNLTRLAALLATSFVVASVHAADAEHTFNLELDVDSFLTITQPSGQKLENAVTLAFSPEQGMVPYTADTAIASNSIGPVRVKLREAAAMSGVSSNEKIDLKVSLGGLPITPNAQLFSQEELEFKNFQSKQLEFKIEAANPTAARFLTKDRYVGDIVLQLENDTAAL